MSSALPQSAAILLIGNEILSGKIADENARWLVGELRAQGVTVGRIEVVPDLEADIVERLRALSLRFTYVFTSGGVGPTHDDVTMAAVATAFGMLITRSAALEALLRRLGGGSLHERDLRMADVPDGARLEYGGRSADGTWPVVAVRNVYVLPGVPSIFRRKFDTIRHLFRGDAIWARAVYSSAGEGQIAEHLDAIVAAFPGVEVGSYPHPGAPDHKVKVTLDGRDRAAVDTAVIRLCDRLGPAVVRVE